MLEMPQRVREEIEEYPVKLKAHLEGQIEGERFKPYRVSMGIYEQRDNHTYMVRTRIPGGVITFEQLKKINELADLYSHGKVHLTTRQDIQFHKVQLEDTALIIKGLLEVGIMTRGTGGNTARNVVCSPLAGVSKEEAFDVTQDALLTTSFLLEDKSAFELPRKYKIGFSNTWEDTSNATISDLGFVAVKQGETLGYKVYGAGGLGGKPVSSIVLADFIPREDILYYVRAMKNLFEKEGDRTNKHSARIRFIRYRLGEETFIQRLNEEIHKLKKEETFATFPLSSSSVVQEETEEVFESKIVVPQKQKGRYSVYVHPVSGNIETAKIKELLAFLEGLGYETSIRFTNTQGFYVRDLKAVDTKTLLNQISTYTSSYPVNHSVACAGAATCKLGLCLSQNLLGAIVEKFEEVEDSIKDQLPRIFISGCTNSCGQHQKGQIGFAGKAKRTEKGLIPHYTLFLEGEVGQDAALGTPKGDLPAKQIPDFLVAFAKLKQSAQIDDFKSFLEEKQEEITKLLKTYGQIDEADENLYYDFGANEPFSLKGRGPGECSAGVLDVIRLDLGNAKSARLEYDNTKNQESLYKAAVSASRALLVLKGEDSTKDRVIFKAFGTHFIQTGLVKKEIEEVIEALVDYKLGDIESITGLYEDVVYLIERVNSMFESLSPQLEITLEKEWTPAIAKAKEEEASVQIVDFKGVKCPINFVKVKIELSKIQSGQSLGFYLDDGEPIQNVPKSVEAEGHTIVKIEQQADGYHLLVVQKK
jgi:sulfite reductase (ferredoxin)